MKEDVKTITIGFKQLVLGALILGVVAFLVVSVVGSGGGNSEAATGEKKQGSAQMVALRAEGGQYVLDPPTLKLGVPVRMVVDLNSVQGCLRSIVIPEWGIRKLVTEGDNVIEFTPTTPGNFGISCSMGMGRGTINIA